MVLADFLIKSVSAPTAVVGSEGANQRHFIYAVAFKFFKHNIKCKVRKILDNHKLIVKVRRIVGQRFNILNPNNVPIGFEKSFFAAVFTGIFIDKSVFLTAFSLSPYNYKEVQPRSRQNTSVLLIVFLKRNFNDFFAK